MKKEQTLAAMVAGLLLSVGAVLAAREASNFEDEGRPIPRGDLPTARPLNVLQKMDDALRGRDDPLARKTATPPGGGSPEPLPYSVPQRIAYGFFVLSPQQAAAALQEADPDGREMPRHLTYQLLKDLSRPGASSSEVIRVRGRMDPGPGVGVLLAGLGFPGVLPPLFGDPVYLDHAAVRDLQARLSRAIAEGGGAEAIGRRATLWRVKTQAPDRAAQIGPLPPPGEALREAQIEIARQAGAETEIQLIRSLLRALKTGAAAEDEGLALLMLKTVG